MAGPEADDGWTRLWRAARSEAPAHPVDPGALGEYAVLLRRDGPAAAAVALPAVAAHLRTGCAACVADLAELAAWAEAAEPPPATVEAPGGGRSLGAPPARPIRDQRFRASRLTAGVLAAGLAVALLVGVSRLPWTGTDTIGEELGAPAPAPAGSTPLPTAAPAVRPTSTPASAPLPAAPPAPPTVPPPATPRAPAPVPPAAATATAAIAVVDAQATAQGPASGGTGACSPNQQPLVEPTRLTITLTQQIGELTFRDRNNACIMWYASEFSPGTLDWLLLTGQHYGPNSRTPVEKDILPYKKNTLPDGRLTTQAGTLSVITIRPDWRKIAAGAMTEGRVVLREDDKDRAVVLTIRIAQDRRSLTVDVSQ
jgi:hypothetical protein